MRDALHCLRKQRSRRDNNNKRHQTPMEKVKLRHLALSNMWVSDLSSLPLLVHQIDTFYRLKDFIWSSSSPFFVSLTCRAQLNRPYCFYTTYRIANKSRRTLSEWKSQEGERERTRNQEKNARKSTTLYAKRNCFYLLFNRTGWTRA